jgi:polyphenol oxidase
MNTDAFVLREFKGIPYYSCKAFEMIPHLHHGFSTRHGGAPDPKESSLNLGYLSWDLPRRVSENRKRLLSALHLESAQLALVHQVHSNQVHIIEDNAGEWNETETEADAIVTGKENIALAVKVADCMPVLIADPVKHVVAAVHSGWRGTIKRVLHETIDTMHRAFCCDPADLLVATGPGIRQCCFEVGPEVVTLFEKEFAGTGLTKPSLGTPEKYYLDLYKALQIQLHDAGVTADNCYDLDMCTCCNTEPFFSYRAEGSASGRMMAVIGFSCCPNH